MQKILTLASLMLAATVGIVVAPIISRLLPSDLLAVIVLIFMVAGLLGAFDILKPNFVRRFVRLKLNDHFSLGSELKISLVWACVVLILVAVVLSSMNIEGVGWKQSFLVAAAVLPYSVNIIFYAILDSSGKQGETQIARVLGTILVYLIVLGLALNGQRNVNFYLIALPFSQFVLLCYLVLRIRGRFDFSCVSLKVDEDLQLKTLIISGKYNFMRSIVDYADRLIIPQISVSVFVPYALLLDVFLRMNLPGQYYVGYQYPILCRQAANKNILRNYGVVGGCLALMMALVMICVIPYSEMLVGLYLGGNYVGYGYLVPILILSAIFQGFNIFGEYLLRSKGMYSLLNGLVLWNLCVFFTYLILAVIFFGVNGVLVSVLVLKAGLFFPFLYFSFFYARVWRSLFYTIIHAISVFVIYLIFDLIYLSLSYAVVVLIGLLGSRYVIKRCGF